MAIEHTKHLWRADIIIFLVFILFLIVRFFMIPRSWGQYGHFRADNVLEQMSKPVHHGGRESCRMCHEDTYDKVLSGTHKTVTCELCHAPLIDHIKDDEKIADMPKDKSYTLCARCHDEFSARPKDFPQVVVSQHLSDVGEELAPEVCISCHQPHSPREGL